ncbi:hypothetical protein DHEL01_v212583 [Diaporthe helianthi]|uniref:Uncharacterized protein n=1 Tax=Diaporthe helianthi TaxID=158607 RepID=A0A2P5HFK4_DIAHE|nr:hypothetical protein DHEL01_v212583 [Diaporthe helianthi]
MFRQTARNIIPRCIAVTDYGVGRTGLRGMATKGVEDAAQAVGEVKNSSPKDPSIISSAGAVGKQFNPDGNIGQIGEKVGGPFSKDGAIGSQFDASKEGIAGQVEKAVDGPARPASDGKNIKINTEPSAGSQR